MSKHDLSHLKERVLATYWRQRYRPQPDLNFAALRSNACGADEKLAEAIRQVNQAGGTYHRLDFGNGLVVQGDYDMTRYIRLYGLPLDLRNKTVLDVGSASGYFALECARRGGKVTAVDIYQQNLLDDLLPCLDADVRYVQKNVYDLDHKLGEFDVVVCGSLLLHLPDPFGALRSIRSVCRELVVLATACCPDSRANQRPICEFRGLPAENGSYWHFWDINAAALAAMLLAAGFAEVGQARHFVLASESGRARFAAPHVVISGLVRGQGQS
jgi:2-polyprenyl-3-methyl-5-hydroxy-6-metoxy-1,4-benzoquinol methylase